jgi:methionyl-tRNA formyltransferase
LSPATPPRLRTVLCTRGGLFGALVLRRLLSCERIEICAIVRSTRYLEPRFGALRGSLALLGRCGLSYALYLWCATSLADLLCGFAPVGRVPSRSGGALPVLATRDLNSADGLRFLAAAAPDLLVSAFFDQPLGDAALALPGLGCVNIHPSMLPSFRGVDPVLQASLAHAALGVTVHRMTATLDDGPVLAQRALAPAGGTSVFTATAQLFAAGAELLTGGIERIARRERGADQGHPVSYQSWPTRAEVRQLRRLGGRLMRPADLRSLLRAH